MKAKYFFGTLVVVALVFTGLWFLASSNQKTTEKISSNSEDRKVAKEQKTESQKNAKKDEPKDKSDEKKPDNDKSKQKTLTPQEIETNRAKNAIVTVPILMYHSIRNYNNPNDTIGTNLSVSPDKFKGEMAWLAQNNYQTITVEQIPDFYAGKLSVAKKPIVLTFDDGYKDMYTVVFPTLKSYGFTADLFVQSGVIGHEAFVSKEQIVEMSKQGITIGDHTVNHIDLEQSSADVRQQELTESKRTLEGITGKPVTSLCYPSGRYDDSVISQAQTLGFSVAVTTKPSIASVNSSPMALPRIRVTQNTNLQYALQ